MMFYEKNSIKKSILSYRIFLQLMVKGNFHGKLKRNTGIWIGFMVKH